MTAITLVVVALVLILTYVIIRKVNLKPFFTSNN